MSVIERITRPAVVVLAVLLDAYSQGKELHGYAIMKMAWLGGPAVYRSLDRLEDAGFTDARWEELPPGADRPRQRYYRLNEAGAAAAREIVAQHRPDLLEHPRRVRPAPALRPRPGTLPGFPALRLTGAP
jgi:DNA-binding PadR family transcriptional regulator